MTFRIQTLLPVATIGGLALLLAMPAAPAQQPVPLFPPGAQPQPQPADPDGIDVLARGPVHEAYASSVEPPAAGPIAPKIPPDPVEELPPDQKPEGDNVQWIPGYWQWDEERTDFLWVSGFWRVPPPNRVWVPGSWREAANGFQWVSGFWQETAPQQAVQPEIEYLPPPPAPIEAGPAIPAPTVTSVYVPGTWMWRGRYVWRPGFWIEHRPNWVWVPAHYRWTPVGHVFIDGYWDYPLASRGVLFAPVYFSRRVYVQPRFVYTPVYVVSEPCMVGALFVRRGHGCYYFGDYFEPRYVNAGFTAWCGTVGRNGGFAVGVGVGRAYHYDPLWSYYSVTHRTTPAWRDNVSQLYVGRYRGDIVRPARTLVQQNTVINNVTNVRNVTNVTNNITVVNNNVTVNNTNVTNVAMVAPLKVAPQLQPQANIKPISADVRRNEAVVAKQIRDVAVQRQKLETAVVDRGQPLKLPTDAPKTLKLDVPKAVVARAQVLDEKKAPPPLPIKPVRERVGNPGVVGKIDPKGGTLPPKIDPKGITVPPKVDPKGGTVPPKMDPPKVDPKGLPPKVDPKPMTNPPKIDPKLPVNPPKIDPKPMTPPKSDRPKVDPKPVTLPKVEPKKKIDPPKRVDPKPVTLPPMPPAKVDPPKTGPKPITLPPVKVDPKPVTLPPVKKNPPKIDPKPVTAPPPVNLPKVDPKPVTSPPPGGVKPKAMDKKGEKPKDRE